MLLFGKYFHSIQYLRYSTFIYSISATVQKQQNKQQKEVKALNEYKKGKRSECISKHNTNIFLFIFMVKKKHSIKSNKLLHITNNDISF